MSGSRSAEKHEERILPKDKPITCPRMVILVELDDTAISQQFHFIFPFSQIYCHDLRQNSKLLFFFLSGDAAIRHMQQNKDKDPYRFVPFMYLIVIHTFNLSFTPLFIYSDSHSIINFMLCIY